MASNILDEITTYQLAVLVEVQKGRCWMDYATTIPYDRWRVGNDINELDRPGNDATVALNWLLDHKLITILSNHADLAHATLTADGLAVTNGIDPSDVKRRGARR